MEVKIEFGVMCRNCIWERVDKSISGSVRCVHPDHRIKSPIPFKPVARQATCPLLERGMKGMNRVKIDADKGVVEITKSN